MSDRDDQPDYREAPRLATPRDRDQHASDREVKTIRGEMPDWAKPRHPDRVVENGLKPLIADLKRRLFGKDEDAA